MDRKALSKRLEGLSSVFASETPIATDLKAMAYTLDKMADEKFKEILSKDYSADEVVASEETAEVDSKKEDIKGCDKKASDEGLFWSKEASDMVLQGLIKDVTGSTLTKEQTPDGTKKAEKPATLKEEQTPSIKETLDSDIVKKSQGPVAKSASSDEEDSVEDSKKEMSDTAKAEKESPVEAAQQDVVLKDAPTPGDIDENAGKPEKETGSMEDMAKNESKEAFVSEGVELNAPMIEVSLDSKEAQELDGLFA